MASNRLTLAEELILLALDDERGTLNPLPMFSLDVALGAAILMELMLHGRTDSDTDKVFVLSPEPTGDGLLDSALSQIVAETEAHSTGAWISRLGAVGSDLSNRVIARLVERGVLRSEEKRLLWVFKTRVYPPASGIEEREVKARVMALLYSDDLPESRDALLIGLLRSTAMFRLILGDREVESLQPRIDRLADFEEINRTMTRILAELQILMASARFGMA